MAVDAVITEPSPALPLILPDRPPRRPLAIDLFAGAGGLSLGFVQAGFSIAASVDPDPFAARTQKENLSDPRNPNGILAKFLSEVPASRLATAHRQLGSDRLDVLMGGPPCQGFSRSNMRTRTMDNPKNVLFREFLGMVEALTPRVVVLENVADFARFNDGAVADEIRGVLAAMPIKYDVQHAVLCAADYGVPQRRNRVFFVAVEHGMSFEFPAKLNKPHVKLWDAISDLPRLKNGNQKDVCYYRTEPLTPYQEAVRAGMGRTVANNCVSRNGELVLQRYRYIRPGQNWEAIPDELMTNYAEKQRTHHWIYLRLKEGEPSVTITHFRKSMLIHPRQHRGLSVREAARIQSFPDSFVFHGPLMHQQQQVANAVPPMLARAVAVAVRAALGF
jgi:DNA (cytosine-5)-methyltransferase 1